VTLSGAEGRPAGAAALRALARFALVGASGLMSASCPAPPRDVVPETRDVRGAVDADASTSPAPGDGYLHVARRAHGAVGLVGAHFMTDDDARRIVEHVADDLEACAARVERRGALVAGAVQLVVVTGSRGTAEVTDLTLAPGGPVAANALECILAPLRATALPAARAGGAPALALEATWGPAPAGGRALP
jgi:hypothetical protein